MSVHCQWTIELEFKIITEILLVRSICHYVLTQGMSKQKKISSLFQKITIRN